MSVSINNIFNYSCPLPEPFDTISNKKVKVSSKYGDGSTASTLCATVIKAVHAVCRCMNGSGEGAVGIIDHRSVAEYKSSMGPDAYHLVVYDSASGAVTASVYDKNTEVFESYVLHASGRDGAAVMMALMPFLQADDEFQENLEQYYDQFKVTEKVHALSKRDEASKSNGQTYSYVETDFIKALKNGYVIEIQEPSTIVQPGVLVGLNSLLEQSGTITLPTGEIIERHPDAVVVVTTNISYEGCRGMNQSVLDRMSLVRDVELPEPEVMVQRAMSVTGATDEYQVSQMVQVVNDMAEYCRKNSITDGSYGMRSLIDWIISTEITGDVYHSALYTIISKATADEMDREALISTVLEPIFAPPRKKAAV